MSISFTTGAHAMNQLPICIPTNCEHQYQSSDVDVDYIRYSDTSTLKPCTVTLEHDDRPITLEKSEAKE